MHLHKQEDISSMRSVAFALAPGLHTLGAITYEYVRLYGVCHKLSNATYLKQARL